MCLPNRKRQNAKQRPMNEKHQVAVFDPETCDLRRLPLSQINSKRAHVVPFHPTPLTIYSVQLRESSGTDVATAVRFVCVQQF